MTSLKPSSLMSERPSRIGAWIVCRRRTGSSMLVAKLTSTALVALPESSASRGRTERAGGHGEHSVAHRVAEALPHPIDALEGVRLSDEPTRAGHLGVERRARS